MKLYSIRFAVAVASVWAIAGLLCGVFYKTAPDAYNRTANFLMHSEMFTSTRALGWGHLIAATAAWWVVVALFTGAAAAVYNRALRDTPVGR